MFQIYMPHQNLGCLGLRVGDFYADLFMRPYVGIYCHRQGYARRRINLGALPLVRRGRAILRCLFYAFLPPFVECRWRGYVHYALGVHPWSPEMAVRYLRHAWLNTAEAIKLVLFVPQSEEGRQFHQL
jgi:hypothetical protein